MSLGSNLIVTGTPGVGKTVIAKWISRKYGLEYIPLDELLIRKRLYSGYDVEKNSYIIDIERAREYVYKNISFNGIVIDSHIAVNVVPCELIDYCIVLRCNPYVLLDRLIDKGYSRDKALENVQAEILDVILKESIENCGSNKVVVYDTSEGFEQLYPSISRLIEEGVKPSTYLPDWLNLIYEKGDLWRFFPKGL